MKKNYCIDVLKSIISSRKRGYFSRSVIFHQPYFIITAVLMAAVAIFITFMGYRNCAIPQLLKHYLNITPSGYAEGTGQIIKVAERQSSRKRGPRCSYIVQLAKKQSSDHKVPHKLKLNWLYCDIPERTVITFIYRTDNPSKAVVVDRHDKGYVYSLIILVLIFVYIIWFMLFLSEIALLRRRRNEAINRFKPLVMHLMTEEDFRRMDYLDKDVVLLSDSEKEETEIELTLDLKRIEHHKCLKSRVGFWLNIRPAFENHKYFYVSRHNNICVGMNVKLLVFENIMHCHVYTIKESELRKAAEMPLRDSEKSPPPKKERTVFFVGPWLFRFQKPAEELNLYITDTGIKDYFTSGRK